MHLLREVEAFVAVRAVCQERARDLHRHDLQPRYPNIFAGGYPAELYDEATAERWVKHEKIASPWLRKAYLRYPHFELIDRLMERVQGLGPVLILLFSSGAKGEFTQHRDADVLLVVAEPGTG